MNLRIFLKRHSPEILAVFAVAGLVSTTISAVKAGPKAKKAIEEAQAEQEEPLITLEKVKVAAPHYIPTILSGLATTACIVGQTAISKEKIASLSAGYVMVADQYRRYMIATRNVFGEEGHQKVLDEMELVPKADVYISANDICCFCFDLPEHSRKYLFYDSISKSFFEARYEDVMNALYHLNRNFAAGGWTPLNEYYRFLGIECVCDNNIGWSVYDFEIPSLDIGIYEGEKDGRHCYILSPLFEPDVNRYEEEY